MKPRVLKPVPLTAAAFAPYGDVIEMDAAKETTSINYGNSQCWHDVAQLNLTANEGRPILRLFRSTPVTRPVAVKVMERHPLSSQAFYPLSGRPYMVAVAEKGELNPDKIKTFIASANQGVNYHAGTWHHYSLALDESSDFLVIDRDGPGENCDEVAVDNTVIEY